jgi:sugar lactone lactonase YvrE
MGVSTDGTGNVYLSERYGSRIRKISASGDISTIAGTGEPGCGGDGGPGVNAQVSSPYGVTGDSRGGVYIVDLGCDSVRHITSDGMIHTVTNSLAYDVALDQEGGLYVSQFAAGTQSGGQIVRISPDGQTTRFAQVSTWSLAVDPAGNLYITAAGKIQVISPSGTISDYADLDAYRLATDAAGNLYAAGVDGHVYKVDGASVSPIDGLANVVALAAGIGDSLFVSQQPLVQDPAHSDNRISKVSVSGRPVRSSHTNRDR